MQRLITAGRARPPHLTAAGSPAPNRPRARPCGTNLQSSPNAERTDKYSSDKEEPVHRRRKHERNPFILDEAAEEAEEEEDEKEFCYDEDNDDYDSDPDPFTF